MCNLARLGGGEVVVDRAVMRNLREIRTDELYETFVDRIHTGQLANIPYRTIRSKKNDPKWMTGRLKHYIGVKRGIYNRVKAGEEELRPQYNELVRTVKRLTREAKNNYEVKIATHAKNDPKGFYQVYRTKSKDIIGPLKTAEGDLVATGKEMSKILNDYFLTVFTEENTQEMPDCEELFRAGDDQKLIDIAVTKEIVEKEIDRLKKFKSPGPDEIYPLVLKECKEIISEPLVAVFKKSLDSGEVPIMWRQANVVPIFKKGDKTLPSNYRPISLTSIIGKIMESIIARNIREHLEKHNLINESQHGFTKGKSCITNL